MLWVKMNIEQQLQVHWTWSSLAINISCSVHYDNDNHNVDWTWSTPAWLRIRVQTKHCNALKGVVALFALKCNATTSSAMQCNIMQ